MRAGSKVTPYYDPMIAKVVAWGETRDGAIAELDRALAATTHRAVHDEPRVPAQGARRATEFRAGRYDTKFAEVLAKRG